MPKGAKENSAARILAGPARKGEKEVSAEAGDGKKKVLRVDRDREGPGFCKMEAKQGRSEPFAFTGEEIGVSQGEKGNGRSDT